ncbi:tRNA (adenosine(37)-N6)-dimethylallyltransferase MiaA [Olivibacter ginsenosidimutans]|uniref:tRNA dimethylallyltransferase n=1 Tax=Olivibacter ginsenosidimutans TaxID=1176537 RepID=A0ABP9AQ15_9SPHI
MDQIRGLIVLLGPTASGKTSLAVALAKKINGAIISADSRQVYRGMDIGTGKDLAIYGRMTPYLIDIRDAGDTYHIAHFQDDFQEALLTIQSEGKIPILCGGTGLYIQSVLQGYIYTAVPRNDQLRSHLLDQDISALEKLFLSIPHSARFHADMSTKKRLIRAIEIAYWLNTHPETALVPPQPLEANVFGISLPLVERRQRITDRLKHRLEQGLIAEVEGLLTQGIPPDRLKFYGLEYKYVTAYLLGEINDTTLFTKLNTEIHRYAKRQMTYFRKMEKDGIAIHWLDGMKDEEQNCAEICHFLNG